MSEFCLVVPCRNHLEFTTQALSSIQTLRGRWSCIVVDNASQDNTPAYLKSLAKQDHRITAFTLNTTPSFPWAINHGTNRAKADYIIWCNNDVILHPFTLQWIKEAITRIQKYDPITAPRVFAPMSNFVAGRQFTKEFLEFKGDPQDFPYQFHRQHLGQYSEAGFLSGFFLIIPTDVLNIVGELDTQFSPAGAEDNDWIIRAQRLGVIPTILEDIFVFHYGSRTINTPEFSNLRGGTSNLPLLWKKYKNDTPQRLTAIIRAKNEAHQIKRCLDAASTFCDNAILLDDNSTDDTAKIASRHPLVKYVDKCSLPLNERDERNLLLTLATQMGTDWIISIDADEVFEDKLTKNYAQRLMNPVDPHINAYGFIWRTFWNSDRYWRSDGIFAGIKGYRLCRNLPNRSIVAGTTSGLHCGNIPHFPPESRRMTSVRIKHYGYLDEETRKDKFNFYSAIDQDLDPYLIGGPDYQHLIAKNFRLTPWVEDQRITLTVICKDEQHHLHNFLSTIPYFIDDIVVVDTGSTDNTLDTFSLFTKNIYSYPWTHDYSAPRNFALSKVKTPWVLHLDPDEWLNPIDTVFIADMIEEDAQAFIFMVNNYHHDQPPSISNAIRLFRHDARISYKGIVHETVDDSLEALRYKLLASPFRIEHEGFLIPQQDIAKKLGYYFHLNKKALAKDPNDDKAHFNIALHYLNRGFPKKAAQHLLRAARINPKYYHPRFCLARVFMNEGLHWLREARQLSTTDDGKQTQCDYMIRAIEDAIGPEPNPLPELKRSKEWQDGTQDHSLPISEAR